MEFGFSELQNILVASARNFFKKEAGGIVSIVREVEFSDGGYSPDLWRKIAELGWIGVVFPEESGGIGGSFMDLVLILEEMGKSLFPGPFVSNIISGLAVHEYGSESLKEEVLPAFLEGNAIISPALTRGDPSMGAIEVDDRVVITDGGYVVSGVRLFVPYAHIADLLLYRAKTDEGDTLFLMDAKSQGIACTPLASIGADKPCEVVLENVEVPKDKIIGQPGKGTEIMRKIEQWGALSESARIVGMLERVLEMSVEHAKEREQFGKKIGSFQAIQHQAANMATDVDQAKYLTYDAAWKLSEGRPARKAISMAKAWASDSARRCSLLGVTIHGGTGVSEEHDMQLYFRRAKAGEIAFGDGDFHRKIVAEELSI